MSPWDKKQRVCSGSGSRVTGPDGESSSAGTSPIQCPSTQAPAPPDLIEWDRSRWGCFRSLMLIISDPRLLAGRCCQAPTGLVPGDFLPACGFSLGPWVLDPKGTEGTSLEPWPLPAEASLCVGWSLNPLRHKASYQRNLIFDNRFKISPFPS